MKTIYQGKTYRFKHFEDLWRFYSHILITPQDADFSKTIKDQVQGID